MLITTWAVQFLGSCWLEVRCRQAGVVSGLQAIAYSPDTYPSYSLQPGHLSKLEPAARTLIKAIACSPDSYPSYSLQPGQLSKLQPAARTLINAIACSPDTYQSYSLQPGQLSKL